MVSDHQKDENEVPVRTNDGGGLRALYRFVPFQGGRPRRRFEKLIVGSDRFLKVLPLPGVVWSRRVRCDASKGICRWRLPRPKCVLHAVDHAGALNRLIQFTFDFSEFCRSRTITIVDENPSRDGALEQVCRVAHKRGITVVPAPETLNRSPQSCPKDMVSIRASYRSDPPNAGRSTQDTSIYLIPSFN